MIILFLVAILYTNCLQCVNGKILIECPDCKGRGVIISNFLNSFDCKKKEPCRKCSRGLYDSRKKSSGQIYKKCPYCKGKKKLKATKKN